MKKILILAIAFILVFSLNNAFAGKGNSQNSQEETGSCTTIMSGELLNSSGEVIMPGYDDWGYNYQARLFNGYYCDAYQDAAWCQEWKTDRLIMKWNDAWLSNQDCDGDLLLDRHYGHDSYIGSGAWLTNHMSGEYEGENYSWDVSGDWTLDFASGTDNRQFVNLVQDAEGIVTGEFWYLSGSDWLYGGTLQGTVTGDELYLHYERPEPLTYTGDFYGTIGEGVITDGAFTDSNNNNLTWIATGTSEKVYEICSWDYFVKIVAAPSTAYLDGGYWYTEDDEEIGPAIWGEFATIQEVYNDPCAGESGLQYNSPLRSGLGNW